MSIGHAGGGPGARELFPAVDGLGSRRWFDVTTNMRINNACEQQCRQRQHAAAAAVVLTDDRRTDGPRRRRLFAGRN